MACVVCTSVQLQDRLSTADLLASQRCPGRLCFGEVLAPRFQDSFPKNSVQERELCDP